MAMGAGITCCGTTGSCGGCLVVVAFAAVLPVYLVKVVVMVLLLHALWSHLMQYITSLSSNSTSFPSMYLSSIFTVQLTSNYSLYELFNFFLGHFLHYCFFFLYLC